MGKLVLSVNVSLDGVVQDPTGEEGFRHGGWFNRVGRDDLAEWQVDALAEAQEADAILLGRASYEFFAGRWPQRTGAFADRLNAMPKYVVSSTLADPAWHDTRVIGYDDVAGLTERYGTVVVYASRQLARRLLDDGLIDELRLKIFPVVLGAGDRLFGDLADRTRLRPTTVQRLGDTIVGLGYEVLPPAAD